MSSTPLFDAIARRNEQPRAVGTVRPDAVPGDRGSRTPASPLDAPAAVAPVVPIAPHSAVPADLVEMIDGIPASLRASLAGEHIVCPEQLPLVEAVVDAVTRAVVDAVAIEVERIVATGVVRA
jgi:hypothetical protein